MKQCFTSKFNNNKGFTLVELIVVLVLLTIMLSITISAGLGWQDWARFNHEEDVAKDIFYAAQNQLSELDASGALENRVLSELRKTSVNNQEYDNSILLNKTRINSIVYKLAGTNEIHYNWDTMWINANKSISDAEGKVIRLRAEKGDYKKYLSGTLITKAAPGATAEEIAAIESSNRSKIGTKVLFDLVSSYMSDTGILNGSITLEFSPDAGQVFSVCYSDMVDALVYDDTDVSSDKSTYNVMNRIMQNRANHMVGYYSVSSLSQKNRGRSLQENYLRLEMENNNLLVMKVVDTEFADDNKKLKPGNSLKFNIYDGGANGKNKVMSFSIEYNKIHESTGSYAESLKYAAEHPTVVYFDMFKGDYKGKKAVPFRIPVWRTVDNKIYFILDAADVQAQTLAYSKSYAFRDEDPNNQIAYLSDSEEKFRNTYSFYRFGLANTVNYIFADVMVRNDIESTKSAETESGRIENDDDSTFVLHSALVQNDSPKGECTTFADCRIKSGENKVTFDIKNARHLYNIRYETDYKPEQYKNKACTFNLISDVSWKDILNWNHDANDSTEVANAFLNSYDPSVVTSGENKRAPSGIDYDGKSYALGFNGGSTAVTDTHYYPFPGFRKLDKMDTFTQKNAYDKDYDGGSVEEGKKSYTISDLKISISANIVYGIYGQGVKDKCNDGTENYNPVLGLNSITDNSDGSNEARGGLLPLGLFAENLGTISNITLNRHKVIGLEEVHGSVVYTCMVGGFAGNNIGTVNKLTLLNNVENYASSAKPADEADQTHINGRTDVGGIIGRESFVVDGRSTEVELKDLINYGNVSGKENVGGIVGRAYVGYIGDTADGVYVYAYKGTPIQDSEHQRYKFYHDGYKISDSYKSMTQNDVVRATKVTIDNCINRGMISGDKIIYDKDLSGIGETNDKCAFIGGIAGITIDGLMVDGREEDYGSVFSDYYQSFRNGDDYKMMIRDCSSYTKYDVDDLKIFSDTTINKSLLRDNFVGGIVGYGRLTVIQNCNNELDENVKEDYDGDGIKEGSSSFVLGHRFVGGIAGCSDACRYDKADNEYAVTNYSNVIGKLIVGGIMGGNGPGDTSQTEDLTFRNPSDNPGALVAQYRSSNNQTYILATNILNKGVVLSLRTTKSFTKKINEVWQWQRSHDDYKIISDDNLSGMCGGIFGISRAGVFNCDNIQSEDSKTLTMMLVCGSKSDYKLNEKTVDELDRILTLSDFGGNSVGGLGGHIGSYGYINCGKGVGNQQSFESDVDAVVIGQKYVGGILGSVSNGGNATKNTYPVKKEAGSTGMMVFGQDVVGGVFGRTNSTGDIRNVNDRVISSVYLVKGRYAVGGLVGALTTEKNLSISANLDPSGNSSLDTQDRIKVDGIAYVGGAVGICDKKASMDNTFKMQGSDGVAIDLNYIDVTGKYFVGGLAGCFADSKADNSVSVIYNDSFKIGDKVRIKADAFAGGLGGLYTVINADENFYSVPNESDGSTGEIGKETGALYILAKNIEAGKTELQNNYDIAFLNIVNNDFGSNSNFTAKSSNHLTIKKFNDYDNVIKNKDSYTNVASVEAGIYAGGLFGYVPNNTNITVEGFVNNGSIKTTGTISSDLISEDIDKNADVEYSYLGGVVGRVPLGMTLKNCINFVSDGDTAHSKYYASDASYIGGLTEVNAGVITGEGNSADAKYMKNKFDPQNYQNKSIGMIAGVNGTNKTSISFDDSGILEDTSTGVIKYVKNEKDITGNGNKNITSAAGITAAIGGQSAIFGCRNEGSFVTNSTLKIKNVAGIAGNTLAGFNSSENSYKGKIYISDNINLGTITVSDGSSANKSKAAGIVTDTNGCGDIELCRNYGLISVEDGGANADIFGITSGNSYVLTKNLEAGCVQKTSLPDNVDPVSPDGNTMKRNFYLFGTVEAPTGTNNVVNGYYNNEKLPEDSSFDTYFVCKTSRTDNGVIDENTISETDADLGEGSADGRYFKIYNKKPNEEFELKTSDDTVYKESSAYSEFSTANRGVNLGIDVMKPIDGLDAEKIRIYLYNRESGDSSTYSYDVIFTYMAANGDKKTVTLKRTLCVNKTDVPNGYFFDEVSIPKDEDDTADIKPVRIEISIPASNGDNASSWGLCALTWVKESVERTFNSSAANSIEITDEDRQFIVSGNGGTGNNYSNIIDNDLEEEIDSLNSVDDIANDVLNDDIGEEINDSDVNSFVYGDNNSFDFIKIVNSNNTENAYTSLSTDHWSKQLFIQSTVSDANKYNLIYQRNGLYKNTPAIEGLNCLPIPSDSLSSRINCFISSGLDDKFVSFANDFSGNPNNYFVGE